jgi:hypothetical protein
VDCTWSGGSSGSFSGRIDAKTYADDLIISGPASPTSINATLNLHVRVNFSRSGGFPDNNSHTGYLELGVNTPYSGTVSDLTCGNHSTVGTGVFSGVTVAQRGHDRPDPGQLSGQHAVQPPDRHVCRRRARTGTATTAPAGSRRTRVARTTPRAPE